VAVRSPRWGAVRDVGQSEAWGSLRRGSSLRCVAVLDMGQSEAWGSLRRGAV
jgi:hypothetical protein